MNYDAIIRSMRSTSDEELLAITSGAATGYTDQARAIAEAVLRERRVRLPADLKALRKRATIAEAEANRRVGVLNAARDRALGRTLGSRILVLGVGAFVFALVGLRVDMLERIGSAVRFAVAAIAIAEYIVVQRAGIHLRPRRTTNAELRSLPSLTPPA